MNQIATKEQPSTLAPESRVREAVVKLFAAYPGHGAAEMTESAIGTYVAMLREYPMPAIVEAARLFLAGRVGGHNPAFRPSVAQWCVEARRLRDEARAAEYSTRLALAPPSAERRVSDEERAKVDEMMAKLAADLAARASPAPRARPPDQSPGELAPLDLSGVTLSPLAIERMARGAA